MEFWYWAAYAGCTGGTLLVRSQRPAFGQHHSTLGVLSWYAERTPLGINIDFWTLTVDFDFDHG